jgi:hypothetical protein
LLKAAFLGGLIKKGTKRTVFVEIDKNDFKPLLKPPTTAFF